MLALDRVMVIGDKQIFMPAGILSNSVEFYWE